MEIKIVCDCGQKKTKLGVEDHDTLGVAIPMQHDHLGEAASV